VALSAGTKLGPYEVVALLGAGGMGEVFRAVDSRLGRVVALKLLPPELAADTDRLARFEREARVLASLNHPGIAHLYGFEQAPLPDGTPAHFLAMELVEGEDLAGRLARGAVPVEEAVSLGAQIAAALEEAHEKGIVHRDLKPANVKVTSDGRAKVLDFGLAKAWTDEAPGAVSGTGALSQSPTLAHTGTAAGLILGTAAYMSPEQARGKPVDRRADVWSFGVVLYEMLAGRRLFEGETVTDVLAAVVRQEVDWSALPAATPSGVRALLQRCLERDSRQRLRDIGEARIALERAGADGPSAAAPAPAPSRRRVLSAVPWLLAVALAIVAAWPRRAAGPSPDAARVVRFTFDANDALRPMAQLSPDARYVAFNQAQAQQGTAYSALYVRPLASLEATALPQTARTSAFFWSPDGRQLAAAVGERLLAFDPATGVSRPIAELPNVVVRGGTWNRDGVILLSLAGTIVRVDAAGGSPRTLLAPEKDRFSWHGAPVFLPDGRRFLFTSEMREAGENIVAILAADLDSPDRPRVVRKRALAVGFARDYLFWATTDGQLEALKVDPRTLEPAGESLVLARGVTASVDARVGLAAASVAADGSVAFRVAHDPVSVFEWMDRSGRRLGQLGEPGPWHNFDMTLDATRVVAATRRRGTSNALFLIDVARGVTEPASDPEEVAPSDPTFSPDGTLVAYKTRGALVARPVQGGAEKVLVNETAYPDSWSRDGRWLAYGAPRLGHYDLFAVDLRAPDHPPILLARGEPSADEPRFSPSGLWVAYHSGQPAQVFVIPFPPTGERWQLSRDGGVQPRWSPDGSELFYLDSGGRLTSVPIPNSDPRRAGAPVVLFETGFPPSDSFDQLAVASKDRFLLRVPSGSDPGVPVHVILGLDRGAKP
jgi:Tol biopolymer transport system component